MIARLIGLAAAKKSKKRWDPTEEPEILKILKDHANFYWFSTYPWNLWIIGMITISIALYLTYAVYYFYKMKK